MKNKITKVLFFAMIFTCMIFMKNKVEATSISFSPQNPKVGDTVTVTVSVANVNTVDLTANVSGVANGTIRLVNGDLSGGLNTFSQSGQFKCEKEGTLLASVSNNSTAVSNGNYVSVAASASTKVASNATTSSSNNSGTSTSSNTSSGSNKNTSTKSNNAKLKNLGIKPNDFSGFSPSKYAYSTTVPNDVEKVEVYAQEGESGQKVTGTGYKTLKEGSNSFEVVVTAADGKTTQKYTINITRESKDSDKEEKEEKKEEEKTEETKEDSKETTFGLKKLQIAGFDSKIKFDPDVHEYKIDVNEDIDKLDLSVLATDENALIEISGNEDFQEGENVVTILVKDKDGEESVVYQIIVNKSLAQPEQENVVMDLIKDNIPLIIVAGAFVFVLFILIIVVIVKKAKKDDYEDDEYDEEDEDEYYGNENYNSNSLIDSKEDKTSYEDFYNKYDNKEQDDVYVEKPKRKRHAKGKRFK